MLALNRGNPHPRSYSAGRVEWTLRRALVTEIRATGSIFDYMDEMTCPKCESAMTTRTLGSVTVSTCSSCSGIFLERADLGNLIEAENDWHVHSGPKTEPLPRITADMATPPTSRPTARSYIETLFR